MAAMAELLLLHTPPGVALLNMTVPPWQTPVVPVIAEGTVTVSVFDAIQPAGVV